MEGGIAILLLLIIVVAAAIIGLALYVTGGALWFGKTDPKRDRIEGRPERFERPEHETVTNESIENTHVVGTRDDER